MRMRDWSSDVCSSDLQVARCPGAQAGLGDADGSLVTLVVDRHDTALACNLALRRDRPVPEDRLLAMHRITVIETQLRHGDSETARENGGQRWHDLLIDLMDEGQFVPVEGIRRHAKTECITDRVICAPGLSPAGTRFLAHCGILNGHVGILVSGSIAMAHHYRCRSLGGPQVCRPNICE